MVELIRRVALRCRIILPSLALHAGIVISVTHLGNCASHDPKCGVE